MTDAAATKRSTALVLAGTVGPQARDFLEGTASRGRVVVDRIDVESVGGAS